MALDFPNSPTIGEEFTGGGFTWVWTGDSWDKVMANVASGSNGFSLIVGSSGNTTYAFEDLQPAGAYSISSQLGDTTFDVYFVTADNQNAGYGNATTATQATAEFNRVVVYGATPNDKLSFEYKPSASPSTSGDVADGAAPFLTSATPTVLESIDDTTTVTGGNFAADVQIVFVGQDNVERPAKSIVRTNSTSLIVTRPDDFPVAQEPYTMVATNAGITNPSTNVNRLVNYFDAGSGITWVTTSPLPRATPNSPYSITLQATDGDGLPVSYTVTSGSLPGGLTLNSSTGEISGTATVVETRIFTVTATDTGGNTLTREFSLEVDFASYSVDYLVIAGGGAGGGSAIGSHNGGGGGAGEVKEGSTTLLPGTDYTVTVGAGGTADPNRSAGGDGGNSAFHTFTCNGGGGGGGAAAVRNGRSGGSGGAGSSTSSGGGSGGASTASGGGFGNAGGSGGPWISGTGAYIGGAGGGAGSVGGSANAGQFSGGTGRISSITGTNIGRAGGGAAYARPEGGSFDGGGLGTGVSGQPGIVNTGGGGAGGGNNGMGGNGGTGVVIISYPVAAQVIASGGLTSYTLTNGTVKVTVFTSGTGTFQLVDALSATTAIEFIVIGGGGGGGSRGGGAGGAGGYISSVSGESSGGGRTPMFNLAAQTGDSFTVTVGAGNAGTLKPTTGTRGSDSSISQIIAFGGSNGRSADGNFPQYGGSGGGFGNGANSVGFWGGTSMIYQGFAGGASLNFDGAGGGGAGQAGFNTASGSNGSGAGSGGAGVTSSITGSAVARAGGGGGGSFGSSNHGTGGAGGGGNGADTSPQAGAVNTGGGGGGAGNSPNNSGAFPGASGGSGVVIMRYPSARTLTVAAGLTSTTTTVGGNKVTVFTAGTGTVTLS